MCRIVTETENNAKNRKCYANDNPYLKITHNYDRILNYAAF